jgi:F-type H+-transporting ATPase subunit a
VVFIGVTVIGIAKHGWHFLSFFVPHGVSVVLLLLLVPIELLSYLIRPFTLSIRLFANMMAGHTMLAIFAGFVAPLLLAAGAIKAFAVVPLAVDILLIFLELLVAALQAYVFTILTCLYLRDAIHLH